MKNRKRLFSTGIFFLMINMLFGQRMPELSDPVLFSYGNKSVTKSEFEYVFRKNNPEIKDPTLEDLKEYLDLYVKFKLKVAAAEDARIDTMPSVRNDLKTYLDQLYQSYLEKLILDPLLQEVAERWNTDVRARHILIRVKKNASPEDTAKAYQKIVELRERIVKGEDFEKVAREYSEDQYVKINGGDIGYVAVLNLPFYNFENALYETQVGEVSKPVRTTLGYHLVLPTERRPAMGSVTVAHILIKVDQEAGPDEDRAAYEEAMAVYKKLQEGEDFATLAAKFSDDEATKTKGGEMRPFGTGQMVPEFEKAAYSLEKDSSFTKPFRTRYGYHILMLLDKKDKPPFDDHEARITRQIKKDERYRQAKEKALERFKKQYGFKNLNPDMANIVAHIDSGVYFGNYQVPDFEENENKALFELDGQVYTTRDFIKFIELNQRYARNKSFEEIVKEMYDKFVERTVMERAFADRFPEYQRLKNEYRDGIMMFAMMQDSVWNKALADSAGLMKYYQEHKDKYWWKERAKVDVFHIYQPNDVNLKKLKKQAKKYSREELLKIYNDSTKRVISIESEVIEKGENSLLTNDMWKKGWYEIQPEEEGEMVLVHVKEIIPAAPKTLDEARGNYIADYQTQLENEWIERLKKKYPVKINEEVLKSIAGKN